MFVEITGIVRVSAQPMPYGCDIEIRTDSGYADIELCSLAQVHALREACDEAMRIMGGGPDVDVTQDEMFPERIVADMATIDAGE